MGKNCVNIAKKIVDVVLLPIPPIKIPRVCQDKLDAYQLQISTIAFIAADVAILTSKDLSQDECAFVRAMMLETLELQNVCDSICDEMPVYQYIINQHANDDDLFVKLGAMASNKITGGIDTELVRDATDRFILMMKTAQMIIATN